MTIQIEPKTKEQKLALLKETAGFYNSGNRSTSTQYYITSCHYYGLVGCAIGRLIPDKQLCRHLDNEGKSSVEEDDIFQQLPEELQAYGQDFLAALQKLHDDKLNWDCLGLSTMGELYVAEVANRVERGML